MPEQYVLQETKEQPQPEVKKKLPLPFLIGGGVLAFALVFGLGLILGTSLTKPQAPVVTPPTPTPTIPVQQGVTLTPTPMSEVPLIKFLPGKQYFDDTYVIVQKQSPHQTVILAVSRIEQERNFLEYTKVNYFNGTEWDRKTLTTTLQSNAVATNPLLRAWNEPTSTTQTNPRPLAVLEVGGTSVSFISTDLQNEISVQSLPGSTRFIYQGEGTLTVGTESTPAYVFRSRTYSFNAADLSFITRPETLTSDWLLFWDTEGVFYYLNSYKTPSPQSPIQSLRIGVREDRTQQILRTSVLNAAVAREKETTFYHVTFDTPLDEEVNLPLQNIVHKSTNKSYTWDLGISEGSAVRREGRTVPGVGVFEYIKPNR